MNALEHSMYDALKRLKDEYGILAVKAEFEAEGSRTDELVKLNEIVFRNNMNLYIKIGGCEAVRDLDQCRLLGATGIMAPMIETPFAMRKFCEALKKVYGEEELKNINVIINAETITAYRNFEDILSVGQGTLDTIAVGRVDLSASMGLGRSEINGDKVFELTEGFGRMAAERGVTVGFGGGISLDAVPFLQRMQGLVSRFETRKIVFDYENAMRDLHGALTAAIWFEYLYLQNKCEFYGRMAHEDEARMKMMKARYDAAIETK